ncbi:MAG: hypothetical protein GF333_05355 [Candidatus Omnitrophica bacterium]|nr:hypothetical protein [Candidatus Omnitrophota bacterium]
MLHFIIDGFNLIHAVSELEHSRDPHPDLMYYLKRRRLTGSRNNRVTVVFDGWPPLHFHEKEYRVVFSGDRDADTSIVARVRASRPASETVVVTDDRQLRQSVKKLGARVRGTREFLTAPLKPGNGQKKHIPHSVRKKITDEMSRIWLNEDTP